MKLSVIIPTLNEEIRIVECINSAFAAGAHEVIVSDGGSQDQTLLLAKQTEANVVNSPKGRAVQQNAGAVRAVGDVFLFLHADCKLDSTVGDQLAHAIENPNCLGGAFRQKIIATGARYRLLEFGNTARVRFLKLPFGDQGIFMRRTAFESLGGFEEIPLMEDLRLMKAFRKLTKPVLLPGPIYVCARRWQQNGVIRQTLKNWTLQVGEKLGISPTWLSKFYSPSQED